MATIAKRGDLQWQVKVRRRGYPVQSRTFDTKAAAEKWARMIEREMDAGQFVDRTPSEKTTLRDVIERYIRDELPTHKGQAEETLRLRAFVRDWPDLAGRRIATLRPEDFEAYRDARLEAGLAAGTVKRELGILHTVIESNRRRLGLMTNPISHVRRPKVRDERNTRFQDDEEARLMAAVQENRNPWLGPAITLAIETGMRRGELLALRWEDIDLEARVAHLRDTKNGDARDVPLSPRAVEILRNLPRSLDGRALATTASAIQQAFERARARAGLVHFRFHDLRHEATSRLFERGWNIMEVAAVTGHRDLAMLRRYTNLKAAELAKKLSN